MTAPNLRYRQQPMPVTRPTVSGQRFYNVRDREVRNLIEYMYAHYAQRYNIELVLLTVLPDTIVSFFNDPDANGSRFLSATHSAIMRRLNARTGHTGPMIQPGTLDSPAILNKEDEIQLLAELAASPTVAIQPGSKGYIGTIFTPESKNKTRRVKRPADLNPKTYPEEELTYKLAKPQFQKEDSWRTIEKRMKTARLKVEAQNREKLRAAGKRYIGINTPALVDPNAVHADRLSPPRGRRYRGTPKQVEIARKQERHFRRTYRECLLALREDEVGIVWPAGTNFHHKINGFPRLEGDWLSPPPPA